VNFLKSQHLSFFDSLSCTPQTSIFEKRQDFNRYQVGRKFKPLINQPLVTKLPEIEQRAENRVFEKNDGEMLLQDVKMSVISVEFITEPGKYFLRARFLRSVSLPYHPLFPKKNDIANGSFDLPLTFCCLILPPSKRDFLSTIVPAIVSDRA
jgi:hypothetical protein